MRFSLTPPERAALLLSTLAGASTTLGAAAAVVRRPGPAALAGLLGLAAGVMAVLAVWELWWENGLEHGFWGVSASFAGGAALYAWAAPHLPSLEGEAGRRLVAGLFGARFAEEEGGGKGAAAPAGRAARSGGRGAAASTTPPPPTPAELLRLGLIMAATMTLHNLPEGVAVAAAAAGPGGAARGLHVAAAVAAHNIPEGLIISGPVYAATGSRWAALGLAAASGLSEPVGAAGALLASRAWDWAGGGGGGVAGASPAVGGLLPFLLAGAGGVMAAVCALDLVPEAVRCGAPRRLAGGAALGGLVMAATLAAGV